MDKTILFLVGLPGCGKSTWIKNNNHSNAAVVDDPMDFSHVKSVIKNNDNIIIADPRLCDDWILTCCINKIKNIDSNIKMNFLYWKNDVEACWNNVEKRADGRIISKSFLIELSKKYKNGNCSTALPIYKGNT